MKGREDMFKLLQNEYEEYQEYFNELELIQRQYNQEEAYYFIINKLIRDSINDKDISVRDVHKLIKAKDFPERNRYLRGYDGQVSDFVILRNDFKEKKDEKDEDQSDRVYGCVEIKPFSKSKGKKDNRKLYSEYISPIKNLLDNKELVEVVNVVWNHKKLYRCNEGEIKIEFESSKKKEEFIENYFKEDNNKSIPISLGNGDIKEKVFLCVRNQNLCLQIEEKQSKESEESKIQLEIQKRNDKGVLVLQDSKNEYPVELKSEKTNELFFLKEKVFDNKTVFNNKTVCELLKELIGFKKVIFTNGYQWILMQCKEVKYSKPNFKIVDEKGIEATSQITVKDFQCKSLANFYPEPKDEATFNRLISSCEKDTRCKMISSCEEDTQCKKIAQCKKARETIEEFDGSWGELGFEKKWSAFKKKDREDIKQAIEKLKNCYLKNFLEVEDINKVRSNLGEFELCSVSRYLDLGLHLTEFQTVEDFKAWTDMTFDELRLYNFGQWLHLKFGIKGIFKEAKSKQREEKSENDE